MGEILHDLESEVLAGFFLGRGEGRDIEDR